MPTQLKVTAGQHSEAGRKPVNQDFHGLIIPREPQLGGKGIAIALADGISSSEVSQVAAQAAVTNFLQDYYCTSEAWSVKTAAERVLAAANSWLHAQTRGSQFRYEVERGYVCTFSGLVLKSATAHLFHVGDARIYRVSGKSLEQLTIDHRVRIAGGESYLGRALGINPQLEIDYLALPVEIGDTFVLATDGVHEYVAPDFTASAIRECADDLDAAARVIAQEAYRRGSPDNLTVQILRIDELPPRAANELQQQYAGLPAAPLLEPRMLFDGYRILEALHSSSRSHVYLALDEETQQKVILKVPSIDLRDDPAYLESFMMEEWVARRVHSPHLARPLPQTRPRHYLYVAAEYIEGQSLAQWMLDHPRAPLEAVRGIVEQVARGLRALHRLEMLHQDLRPENIIIASDGTVKIIDFGATRVAGLAESGAGEGRSPIPGTPQYAAPEYFLGEPGSVRSDLFSLAVIAYRMLTADLPYGVEVAKTRSRLEQIRLTYEPALRHRRDLPPWVDGALKKALHPDPQKRYAEISEFLHDLRTPNPAFVNQARPPLLERDPVAFWKGVSALLALIVLALLIHLLRR
ncbi:MAG TPA: bifunctional protein-serine/threonine kinase/phosphatase [Burkholderiales bacterium]|jgi:serine/threonine protein phosphatase PrpC